MPTALSPKKFDNLGLGIALGALGPIITTLILARVMYPEGYLDIIVENTLLFVVAPKIISLAVLPNLASFMVFIYTNRYSSAKGVLGATILVAILVFTLKLSS